ncbi:hypothetical protein ACFVYA_07510 [Amycolatopsis sp. NPDC058278]|uniref:hypothetical protein n=1 Tax=Amycolatopsis sp. NPDC058278 TaxID=3346417 RepID=UPI0036DAD631
MLDAPRRFGGHPAGGRRRIRIAGGSTPFVGRLPAAITVPGSRFLEAGTGLPARQVTPGPS